MAGREQDFSDLGTFPSLLPVLIVSETDLRRGLYLCVWNHILRWGGRIQNLSQGTCQADSLTLAQITEHALFPILRGMRTITSQVQWHIPGCNHRFQEAEAKGLQISSKPELHRKSYLNKQVNNKLVSLCKHLIFCTASSASVNNSLSSTLVIPVPWLWPVAHTT